MIVKWNLKRRRNLISDLFSLSLSLTCYLNFCYFGCVKINGWSMAIRLSVVDDDQ